MANTKVEVSSPVRTGAADEAYHKGYSAYWRRGMARDNPYQPGSDQYAAWNRGWVQGEIDECEE